MTIWRLLNESKFEPQQRQLLDLAYRRTLRSLHLADGFDAPCEIVAQKVMEVGARGVTNAIAISEIAMRELRLPDWSPGG